MNSNNINQTEEHNVVGVNYEEEYYNYNKYQNKNSNDSKNMNKNNEDVEKKYYKRISSQTKNVKNINNNKIEPNIKINKYKDNINNQTYSIDSKKIIINPEDTFGANNNSKEKISYSKTNEELQYNVKGRNIIIKKNQNILMENKNSFSLNSNLRDNRNNYNDKIEINNSNYNNNIRNKTNEEIEENEDNKSEDNDNYDVYNNDTIKKYLNLPAQLEEFGRNNRNIKEKNQEMNDNYYQKKRSEEDNNVYHKNQNKIYKKNYINKVEKKTTYKEPDVNNNDYKYFKRDKNNNENNYNKMNNRDNIYEYNKNNNNYIINNNNISYKNQDNNGAKKKFKSAKINKYSLEYFCFLITNYMKKASFLMCVYEIANFQKTYEKNLSLKLLFMTIKKRIIFYKIKFFHRFKKINKYLVKYKKSNNTNNSSYIQNRNPYNRTVNKK